MALGSGGAPDTMPTCTLLAGVGYSDPVITRSVTARGRCAAAPLALNLSHHDPHAPHRHHPEHAAAPTALSWARTISHPAPLLT